MFNHIRSLQNFMNGWALRGLHPPAERDESPATELDGEALEEENNNAFLRFEIVFSELPSSSHQRDIDNRSHLSRDSEAGWMLIEKESREEVVRHASRVRVLDLPCSRNL